MDQRLDKAIGSFIGLAVGDALGTTLEFGPRRELNNLHTEMTGGGEFFLEPGEWTDDTAMALALAESLRENGKFSSYDVLRRWCDWYKKGTYSCTGTCFDIGGITRRALDEFIDDPTKLPAIDEDGLGNGSLMRLAPVVLASNDLPAVLRMARRQARLTHGTEAVVATVEFAEILFRCIHNDKPAFGKRVQDLPRDQVRSTGYYRDTLTAALWSVSTTGSFESALIAAVNLGDDADTVGAVTGQLAGALYGFQSIPKRWLDTLAWNDRLMNTAASLASLNLLIVDETTT